MKNSLAWTLNVALFILFITLTDRYIPMMKTIFPDGCVAASVEHFLYMVSYNAFGWGSALILAFIIWLFNRKTFGKKLFKCLIAIWPVTWLLAYYGSQL
jgi:hypothetical protein